MRRALWLLLALSSGCLRYYPGDGQLVLVTLDDAFYRNSITDTDGTQHVEADDIEQGLLWWNVVGARLRTKNQIELTDLLQIDKAPRLHISRSDTQTSLIGGGEAGQYDSLTGEVTLYAWAVIELDQAQLRCAAAHEVGHAMGLQHVADPEAVMYYALADRTGINDSDIAEFTKYWP